MQVEEHNLAPTLLLTLLPPLSLTQAQSTTWATRAQYREIIPEVVEWVIFDVEEQVWEERSFITNMKVDCETTEWILDSGNSTRTCTSSYMETINIY